jgi:type I restriction enzyme S subunit
MNSEWTSATIEEIAADESSAISIGPFGSRMKSECYVESGIPVVMGSNIADGKYPAGNFVFVTEEKASELKSSEVRGGDLVFPHRGAIGRVALIPRGKRMILSSSLMKLTPNQEKCCSEFLLYFFRSSRGVYELLKNASTVGTPGIGQPLSSLRQIPLEVPPLGEQRAIAHILGALDDKIELNRKTNETLEAMARVLFQSWFVDFDPVRAKAEGRPTGLPDEISDLFPNSFQDSELGEIPSGWESVLLGDVSDWRSGSTPSKANPEYWGGAIPWISANSMKDTFAISSDLSLTSAGIKNGGRLAPAGAILLLVRGSGLHSRIPCCIASREMAFNQDVKAITEVTGSSLSTNHIFAYLRARAGELLEMVEFTGIGAGKLDTARLQGLPITVPIQRLAKASGEILDASYERIKNNLVSSMRLGEIRDVLLPLLISGELRIPEAERLLEEAGV